MKWSEIKKWAKTKGYNVSREKAENTDEYTYEYTWTKDDKSAGGLATSVKGLATDIFNNITNNRHLAHQLQYQQNYDLSEYESEKALFWFKNGQY
tara:strand:- start:833 stop:1117 length:285 start_codon:yes stop_codon:yes gene_type:complete